MNWSSVSPSLVLLFRSLASEDMTQLQPEFSVCWMNRNIPFISPTTQEGTYLKVTNSKTYGKPASVWIPHQITTITPDTTTQGTVYSGKIDGHTWSYTVPSSATLTTICGGIRTAIIALVIPAVTPTVIAGPKVSCDILPGTELAFTNPSAHLVVDTNTNVQQSLLERGRMTIQVQVKSLESTDTSWSLFYLENIRTNIWSEPATTMLTSLGLALIAPLGDILDNSAPIDQREASIGTMDLKFSFVAYKVIPVDTSTIEHVSGVAHASIGATIEQVVFQADKPT
jgi:hypothetical protein